MIPYFARTPDKQKEAMSSWQNAASCIPTWRCATDIVCEANVQPERSRAGGFHTTRADFPGPWAYAFRAIQKSPRFSSAEDSINPAAAARPIARDAQNAADPFSKFGDHSATTGPHARGHGGFDAERHRGITVNRWAHGYAFAPIRCSIPSGKKKEPGHRPEAVRPDPSHSVPAQRLYEWPNSPSWRPLHRTLAAAYLHSAA